MVKLLLVHHLLGSHLLWHFATISYGFSYKLTWPSRHYLRLSTVCWKPQNFSFVLLNAVVKTVGAQINAIWFIFFQADVRMFGIRITAWRKRNQNRWHLFRWFSQTVKVKNYENYHTPNIFWDTVKCYQVTMKRSMVIWGDTVIVLCSSCGSLVIFKIINKGLFQQNKTIFNDFFYIDE